MSAPWCNSRLGRIYSQITAALADTQHLRTSETGFREAIRGGMLVRMWRSAQSVDDEAIVEMCIALNAEDPGAHPVPAQHMRRTLNELRRTPVRGHAVVLELESRTRGYALLVLFWSN